MKLYKVTFYDNHQINTNLQENARKFDRREVLRGAVADFRANSLLCSFIFLTGICCTVVELTNPSHKSQLSRSIN